MTTAKRRARRIAADEAHAWARNLRLNNPHAKLTLSMLSLYVDGDGFCFVSIPTLADDTELSHADRAQPAGLARGDRRDRAAAAMDRRIWPAQRRGQGQAHQRPDPSDDRRRARRDRGGASGETACFT
jgi:hypothetical protein